MCDQSELKRITEAVSKAAQDMFAGKLDRVILYGSYARGDFSKYSDIDIMVVVDCDAEELMPYRSDMACITSDLCLSTDDCTMVSVALQDKVTFEKFIDDLPFFINVKKEGVIIYAA